MFTKAVFGALFLFSFSSCHVLYLLQTSRNWSSWVTTSSHTDITWHQSYYHTFWLFFRDPSRVPVPWNPQQHWKLWHWVLQGCNCQRPWGMVSILQELPHESHSVQKLLWICGSWSSAASRHCQYVEQHHYHSDWRELSLHSALSLTEDTTEDFTLSVTATANHSCH